MSLPHSDNVNYHNLDRQYLVKQNRKLRMELKQSNTIKQLHQNALMEMNQKYPESQIIPTLLEIIHNTSSYSKIQQLNQKIMHLQAKLIVLQKIASQTEQNEKQTYYLLADQFQKLKEENVKKQDQLHKFYQKIGQVDYIAGLVTKYKEIISTTQQTMAFKKEQQQLLDALNLQQEAIKKLAQEKDKLMKINIHMKEEVQKRKDQVRNMTMILINGANDFDDYQNTQNLLEQLNNDPESNKGQQNGDTIFAPSSQRSGSNSNISMSKVNMTRLNASLLNSNPNTTLNFVKMQRQLLKDVKQQDQCNSSFTAESQLDCPQLSILFPDKVQKIIKNKEIVKVPYLNMKKVRQMMAKRQQKMRKQWQQQKNHINPTTKIIQLETELQITRKELASQSLKFRLISDQIKILRLKIDEVQQRNILLTESNLKLQTNYQIIYKDYHICKAIVGQIQRALGESVNMENERDFRMKLGFIMQQNQKKQKQMTGQEPSLTLRNQINRDNLQKIFKFKNVFRHKYQRCNSI